MKLTSKLPDEVYVSGVTHKVHTDFRVWLEFIIAVQAADEQRTIHALSNLFVLPSEVEAHSIDEVLSGVVTFYTGAQSRVNPQSGGSSSNEPTHCFDADANYIYAAFYQQYGIDLCSAELHYYKFVALFDCLDNETMFKRIVGYRTADVNGIKEKESKARARKMRNMFRLPRHAKDVMMEEVARTEFLAKWSL